MMTQRRILFATLVAASAAALFYLMFLTLSVGGITGIDTVILVSFVLILPWLSIGFWNAIIGFLISVFARDPLAVVNPAAAEVAPDLPISTSTALLLCIRNEMPARLVRNLEAMMRGLAQSGEGQKFYVYVLSDTTDQQIAEQEHMAFEQLAITWQEQIALTYRRREINTGYKAGNIKDFCDRWGVQHDFALVLDADSFMSAPAMLRLVRIMQASPTMGILQSLVVGLPSTSAFTRVFQFGMRLGMRSYTMGSAWWQGDCGPYWGHNAVIRLAPFMQSCEMPILKGRDGQEKHILSHDQLEAVLMRRAGFEVRVYPFEDGSWEENPPTLNEFLGRDLRWCAGNMQYTRLLNLPKIKPTSRMQLILAVMMFAGSPAWIVMLTAFSVLIGTTYNINRVVDLGPGSILFISLLLIIFLPKLSSAAEVMLRASTRRSFGGLLRFSSALVIDSIFSLLLTSIMWVSQTVFLAGLLFGKNITWSGQARDDHVVPVWQAVRRYSLHFVVGALLIWPLAHLHPETIPYALVFIGGLLVAIPLAVITSWPSVGLFLKRIRWFGIPEEFNTPAVLKELSLPALSNQDLRSPDAPPLSSGG
jgi:membrane glycosyltransferase